MSDAAESTTLSVDDVIKLISGARSGTSDPVSTSIAIFQGLSENASLSGDILRLALSQASLSFEGPLTDVLAAVGSITKIGGLVTFTNSQELRPVIHGTTLRLKQTVAFNVGLDGQSFPEQHHRSCRPKTVLDRHSADSIAATKWAEDRACCHRTWHAGLAPFLRNIPTNIMRTAISGLFSALGNSRWVAKSSSAFCLRMSRSCGHT